jgi:hypothetical protein
MTSPDSMVRQILDHIEPRINMDHVREVRARHQAALEYQTLDIPPLVCNIPYAGAPFTPYPYPDAFADPAKMMVNELLLGFTSIYHAIDVPDDAPYTLRPNLGTVIIASMFGSHVRLVEDNMPWASALPGLDALRDALDAPLPDVHAGLGQRVADQYAYYHAALADYPACREAIEITFPDMQSPFDTAEMLWGSAIFPALYEEEGLVRGLLGKIAQQMLDFYRFCEPMIRESMHPSYHWQHASGIKGKLLLREDSTLLMSPRMYRDIVMPHDIVLARELRSIAIHFCGNGEHQLDNYLNIPGLHMLDLGQPEMMNMAAVYGKAAARRVALGRVTVPPDQLSARQVRELFPAGVIMTYRAESVADAQRAWQRYCG